MGLAKDLMGVSIPDQAAKLIGYEKAAVTAAGSSNSDATTIGKAATLVLVSSTGGSQGVKLPADAELGVDYVLGNISGNALVVYPPALGQINGDTATTGGVPLTARGTTRCTRVDAINWIAVVGAAG
jgi:hypothetical protein